MCGKICQATLIWICLIRSSRRTPWTTQLKVSELTHAFTQGPITTGWAKFYTKIVLDFLVIFFYLIR